MTLNRRCFLLGTTALVAGEILPPIAPAAAPALAPTFAEMQAQILLRTIISVREALDAYPVPDRMVAWITPSQYEALTQPLSDEEWAALENAVDDELDADIEDEP